ncbi:MAG TPA: glycosyltransferase [Kofleriaceae bacterium]|jgi:glycosyltransferase involved in cell wall biosynthesis|nr:glycosyltransferase [Kofleriaceae bacterium]
MKVLLLAERDTSFQGRYLVAMSGALVARGAEFATSIAGTDLYRDAASSARDQDCDHVHACFMQEAPALLEAITSSRVPLTWSFSTFGLGAVARSDAYREAFKSLIEHDAVSRMFVHSIHPAVAARRARELALPMDQKVAVVREPIYDSPNAFSISKVAARRELSLPADRRIALCFGSFSHKKGGDLLATVAKRLPEPLFLFAGTNAKSVGTTEGNVRVDDGYIDYRTAAQYFRAADFVVLPYRRTCEDNSSGVLVQAALAERPVVVPSLSPFQETVADFELGTTFECENVDALTAAVESMTRSTDAHNGFAGYLAGSEPWSRFAALVDDRS